jgi:hypothetical protein
MGRKGFQAAADGFRVFVALQQRDTLSVVLESFFNILHIFFFQEKDSGTRSS